MLISYIIKKLETLRSRIDTVENQISDSELKLDINGIDSDEK